MKSPELRKYVKERELAKEREILFIVTLRPDLSGA